MDPETQKRLAEAAEKGRYNRLKIVAQLTGELDKYVYLRETPEGRRYLEYAFIEGVPDNNRCMAWINVTKPEVGKIYRLSNEVTKLSLQGDLAKGWCLRPADIPEKITVDSEEMIRAIFGFVQFNLKQ